MATTYTRTKTKTETFTRIVSIKNQFKIAFLRLTDYTDDKINSYLEAINERKIEQITFWAYKDNEDGMREKWCELIISVDWSQHKSYILNEQVNITFKKSWKGVFPEITTAIEIMEETINEFDLECTFSVSFVKDISKKEYNFYMKKLGLVEGVIASWRNEKKSVYKNSSRELPELTSEINVQGGLMPSE